MLKYREVEGDVKSGCADSGRVMGCDSFLEIVGYRLQGDYSTVHTRITGNY